MPHAEAVAFYRALRTQYEEVERSLTTIDARNAQASVENDRLLIYGAIESSMGFDAFNEQLHARMSQCLAELSTAMVAPRSGAHRGVSRGLSASPLSSKAGSGSGSGPGSGQAPRRSVRSVFFDRAGAGKAGGGAGPMPPCDESAE
ncbi:hypothetical protein T492DRAFT_384725 [Pavlovales sp. CCMP2436]|nr:hypothetical protein T492DRAFT_384725 [Pavlovales sp. CCMP2436]